MADALSGKTEVDATIEEIVATRIQEVLTSAMVVWPLMQDYSSDVGPGMDKLKIPRFGNFTVNRKAENTAVDAQTNTFSTDDLDLDKYDVIQFLLEDIASLQSKITVISAYTDQTGRDLGVGMDQEALAALEAGVSTSAPDHDVKYNDATNEDLEKVDINTAGTLLDTAKVPRSDRWGIISPAHMGDLKNISEFTRVDESGGSMALRNGEVGKLFGFDIVMTAELGATAPGGGTSTATDSYFGHRSAMAVARQLQPKQETERQLEHLATRYSTSHIYGLKTLDSGKRYVRFSETA